MNKAEENKIAQGESAQNGFVQGEPNQNKKIAAVTGASGGIGIETARQLRDAGYAVYDLSRHDGGTEGIVHIGCDVTDEAAVAAAFAGIAAREGRLDLLVCNAGFGISGATEYTALADAKKQLNVNFFGAFICIKAALPALRTSRGRIVAVGSAAAVFPIPFQAFYSASKAALSALMQALSDEIKPFGVTVCTVLPGDIKTGFTAARAKEGAGQDVYGAAIARSVGVMERDEQNGLPAAYAAKKVVRVAMKKRVKPAYVIGGQYKVFYVLQKLLPLKLTRFIIGKMYG